MNRQLQTNILLILEGLKKINQYAEIKGKIILDFNEKLESCDYIYLENKGWYQENGKIIFEFE